MKIIYTFFMFALSTYAKGQNVDTSRQFSPCGRTVVYAVDDMNLKSLVGENLAKPDINPFFYGGIDQLKKYFIDHPVTDGRAKDIVFRVHIGFIVNCDGMAGSFQLLHKSSKSLLENLSLEVLTIVKDMPQKWQSATADNKPVDSYQILSFTVVGGELDKVSYR
ncbi:hypothetical protein [Puia dinghuensis]|uniref:TonB C-terminal domain-containing protein n=1 Tax=Puia dinghuensis TaxID=1792502 RepID=A0A8J2UB25_9BACT|nr:hypothetical protein [Puia dinghuensis]GGA92486.1 hypothetical protein GCM10011511_14840 [Puia dinghuensis]